MKWIRKYQLFRESIENSIKSTYKSSNLISEICISMILLNNNFLDPLLDGGKKSRYTSNSQVFLTDLKNLLLSKNRLQLGKFIDDKCIIDEETSKINNMFESVEFDIELNWNDLINARICARNIIDKLIPEDKLRSEMIRNIYWIGPNQIKGYNEDIVIELEDGRQMSFYLNKNFSGVKSSSFSTFAEEIIGDDIEKLHEKEYIEKWNLLVKEWVKILYENANKNIQLHIEKFIDTSRIDSLGHFEYLSMQHRDPRFKHLGEHIKEFDKNILDFSDLMSEIWKNKDICFIDPERIYKEWMEKKISIMNSKILEHIFSESITKNYLQDITKNENGYKQANGVIKMKLIKSIVEKMGCLERPIYYLGNNGNSFYQIPSRRFFREFYNDIDVLFDYHVMMVIDNEEENNDFVIRMIINMDKSPLLNCDISVKFTGGEMSGKLGAKFKFEPVDNFSILIANKISGINGNEN